MTFLCFFPFFLLFLVQLSTSSDYSERLVIQPLAPASVLASFNFRGNTSQSSYEQQHFNYFPRSLGQILQHAHTKELHLRFSTGRWDAESWGTRPWDGLKEGGTGVETWAWLEADTEDEAFGKWITLNNALAGLFCASMNFIDSTRTSRPVVTFEPVGDHKNASTSQLHLLHGALPREVVCTENLTPFLKLTPCKGKAGISSLLDGHKLFDATWQTMSIDVRPVCPPQETECILEIEQTIDMVVDIERSKRPRDDPIPRPLPDDQLICDTSKPYPAPDYCYPLDLSTPQGFTLKELFGRAVQGTCLASSTPSAAPICINALPDLEVYITGGATEEKSLTTPSSRCLSIPSSGEFELLVPQQSSSRFAPPLTPPLYAERSITGHGQERGGVRILLTNPSTTHAVRFVYFETLPWFMKPYMHTLKASSEGAVQDMYYRPGLDRKRGSQMELLVSVLPNRTVELAYEFEKAILRYTEYPPDANRGREVPPAVIRILEDGENSDSEGTVIGLEGNAEKEMRKKGKSAYLRTTSLMLPLPTPDFSMPYNVIILTSTVIALAFGTVYNALVRRFVGADEVEGLGLKGLVERVKELVNRIRGGSRAIEGEREKEKKVQ